MKWRGVEVHAVARIDREPDRDRKEGDGHGSHLREVHRGLGGGMPRWDRATLKLSAANAHEELSRAAEIALADVHLIAAVRLMYGRVDTIRGEDIAERDGGDLSIETFKESAHLSFRAAPSSARASQRLCRLYAF